MKATGSDKAITAILVPKPGGNATHSRPAHAHWSLNVRPGQEVLFREKRSFGQVWNLFPRVSSLSKKKPQQSTVFISGPCDLTVWMRPTKTEA